MTIALIGAGIVCTVWAVNAWNGYRFGSVDHPTARPAIGMAITAAALFGAGIAILVF